MKKASLLLFFNIIFYNCFSTHINGGSVMYHYLGNNQYKIQVIVYRDCYNGIPLFDNPASIGIFDGNNILLQSLSVTLSSDSVLTVPGACIPTTICFEKGIYDTIVTLMPSVLPYTIAYQRCCRSQIIQNIVAPGSVGMTVYTSINTSVQNSSAVFNTEIPGFTFVGDNFVFNASATDLDADSLVYSLDNLFDGADTLNPLPITPSSPPYSTLVWQSPYSLTDVLGGTQPLSIDATTGMMTAIPASIGVFQVGEKVDEFRNGNLINSSRREFQLFINPGNYFDCSGGVSVDSNSQSLDVGKAWLIRKNLYDGTLTATDTNAVSTGNYSFTNTINGIYLVKASADSTSPYYANNIPTYYGDVLFWNQSTELSLCTGNIQNVNINLEHGINPGGPGFIGGFISQGANRVMSPGDPEGSITVILFDSNNLPAAYAVTDINGYFSISNLALGIYKVEIDKLNADIYNSLAPLITLSSANPIQNNLAFTLDTHQLILAGTANIENHSLYHNNISIMPNPTTSITSIITPSFTNSTLTLYDITGRVLLQQPFNAKAELDISTFTTGMYILEIKNKEGRSIKGKVVKE